MDARKTTLKAEDAFALIRDVDEIFSMRGKKIIHLDLKREKPDRDTLAQVLLGPTGNLRAPALRKGRTLIVGFDPETYTRLFR